MANSRIFQAAVVDITEHKNQERLVMTLPASLPANCRNRLVGDSSGEYETVARHDVSLEAAASSSPNTVKHLVSHVAGLPQLLFDQVLRSIAATSGPRLTLATV